MTLCRRFAVLLLLPVAVALAVPPAPATSTDEFERGRQAFESSRYAEAVTALEAAVRARPDDAEAHHWLGKAYGRAAEQAPWYQSFSLARKAGRAMERAVEIDPRNTAALKSLLLFYEQAPAVVGGGGRKAAQLRERMRAQGLTLDP